MPIAVEDMPPSTTYDLLIVGGGINGAGIARDAAGRGLKVALIEQDDLASATSSASSKLVHGGLRYLENYEFRLVREALAEREVLLSIAPHISWPLTFVLPHAPAMRPAWMIRAGLFLYDHLARRDRLPGSAAVDLTRHPAGAPLKAEYTRGFTYADGWVDDSRLVILNALDARERGAVVRTRVRLLDAQRTGEAWTAHVDTAAGIRDTIVARCLVNAAGPWVDVTRRAVTSSGGPSRVRLVKGSHIVTPQLYDGAQAYILQQPDRRIVFLLPFAGRFTLIGTTDVPYDGAPSSVAISASEVDYLCLAASRFLRSPVVPAQIVWSYAGLRPLQDDAHDNPSAVTRDYVLELDADEGQPPLLSVIGGKITTYRRLAEHALERLAPWFPGLPAAWTATVPLPGGDLDGDFQKFLTALRGHFPWLAPELSLRLAHAYGTRAFRILDHTRAMADMGEDLGHGLTEREVAYLRDAEFAETAEDILWRRSKLGLFADPRLAARLAEMLRRS